MITCDELFADIAHFSGEALAASFGAFVGAAAAFGLQMLRERKLKADKEYAAIILGQHAIFFMQKTLTSIRHQHLDTQPPSPDRHVALTEFYMPKKYMGMDLPSLTFLFRPNMREIVARCFYAERSFLNALSALKKRNAVWEKINDRPDSSIDLDPTTGIGGLLLTNQEANSLRVLTEHLDKSVAVALDRCREAFDDLRRCAKIVYPERQFLKEDMLTQPIP